MKVVETLFLKYVEMDYTLYVEKYYAAKALIDLTEDEESDEYKEVCEMRDCIHPDCQISIFVAVRFLNARETTLVINRGTDDERVLNKRTGDDYKLVEWLGDFIDRIDKCVVRSVEHYNTDRGRNKKPKKNKEVDDLIGL